MLYVCKQETQAKPHKTPVKPKRNLVKPSQNLTKPRQNRNETPVKPSQNLSENPRETYTYHDVYEYRHQHWEYFHFF